MKKGLVIILCLVLCFIVFVKTNMNEDLNNLFTEDKSSQENNKKKNSMVNTLDDFYNNKLTTDIRVLDKGYSVSDAIQDNCFVIGAMVHNDNLYAEFMDNYKNKKSSFIRIAQNNTGGNLILMDILYSKKNNKLYVVVDRTRDESSDQKMELKQYENIAEYNYENHLYLVLYNAELNDETFKTDSVFVITKIN